MQIYKLCAMAGALAGFIPSTLGDTLTFVPQLDNGVTNYSWFSSGNWFSTDAGGNLIPAGRLPLINDTAIITGMADAGTSGLRVQTLITTNNAIITNGTFAIENLVMLSGSSFNASSVNVLVTLTVGGTNCALNATTLTIISIATGRFQPIAPALAATLNLGQGSFFQDQGQVTLTDGSQIISSAPPQSTIGIGPGAVLNSTNLAFLLGSATNHLIVDNSGTIQAEAGTLRFDGTIDWHSSGMAGEFKAASSNSFLLFAAPFHIDTGVLDTFGGSGTNRWIAGAGVDGAAQVSGNLEIQDSVTGAGTIEVLGSTAPGGVLTWINGSLSLATVTVDSGATMILNGGSGTTRQVSGCTLNNSGVCQLKSGDLTLTQGALIQNLGGGIFKLEADGTFSGASGAPSGSFNNAGTLLKTSSGVTQFGTPASPAGPALNNSGLVDIQNGQLNLSGGTSTGEFRTEGGATLWFWGGTHTLNSGATFSGAGRVQLLEGIAPPTWLVNSGITISNLEIGSNGVIDASGNSSNPVYLNELMAESNASLNNGSFVANNIQMLDDAVVTNSTLTVSNSLTIAGTNCALLGSTLSLLPTGSGNLAPLGPSTNCTLNLNLGAVFQIGGVVRLGGGSVISGGALLPHSRLVVSPGASLVSSNLALVQGTATNHLIIDNGGTIRADAGVLQFSAGLDWQSSAGSGEFKAVLPTSLLVFASPFHNDAGTRTLFSGAGTNQWLTGGTVAGEAQVSGNLQVLDSVDGLGAIHVLDNVTPAGVLDWKSGALNLSGINVDAKGKMLINPGSGSACQLSGCSVNNSGTCLWVGSGTVAAGAATINNLTGGTLNLQTDVALISNTLPLLSIHNSGLLLKSGGKGLSTLAADLHNQGEVQIQSGSLLCEGVWSQTAGSTTVDAGAVLGGSSVNVQGGALQGLGTINANLLNGATVNPGGVPGVLTVGIGYQQTASGTLAVDIAGRSAGTQYDQLVVGGPAALAGRLQLNLINGFAPTPGDRFQLLTCLSLTGNFSSVAPSPLSGMVWVPQYTGSNVTVTLAEAVTLGQPTVSKGVLNLPFNTTVGLSYVVQASGGLTSPNWQTLYTLPGNGAVASFSDSITNAQRFYRVLIQ